MWMELAEVSDCQASMTQTMSRPCGRNVWTQELLLSLGGHNQSAGHIRGINSLGFKHCTDVSQKLCRKGKRWCLSDELCETNVLPLGKVIITSNANGKTCWLSQFTCQRHNERYLYPGMAQLSYPEVVLQSRSSPSKTSSWQAGDMCRKLTWLSLHWQITRAHPLQATGLSAAPP